MLNESWGVPRIYSNRQQQDFSRALYYLAKGLDETRLVISNDGWEMTETDICAFHSYKHGAKEDYEQHAVFKEGLKRIDGLQLVMEKLLFAKGSEYKGQPVVLTECGGITVKKEERSEASVEEAIQQEDREWGYTSASKEDFVDEYARVVGAIYDSELLNGFCYTQLTDVEQETNGLLTSDHRYKFDPEEIRKINERKR